MNELDDALLLCGSGKTCAFNDYFVNLDDGVVRIYQNYLQSSPRLITSWRAINELKLAPPTPIPSLSYTITSSPIAPVHSPSNFVMEWQQNTGNIVAGGNVRVLKVWNVERELCVEVCQILHELLISDKLRKF